METSDAATLGPLSLPVDAGSANAAFTDPVVEALADFLGWILRHDLDDKLANLTGTSSTAVPTSNIFTFDPFHPRAHAVKRPLPSLYVWWDGQATAWDVSMLRKGRKRRIQALYIFEEQPAREEMDRRRGLFAAVDASWTRAADQGGHPEYSYNGTAAGTLLRDAIGSGTWCWSMRDRQPGSIKRVGIDDPEVEMRAKRRRVAHQDYPALWAEFEVEELLQPGDTPTLRITADSPITITNDDYEILERVLEYDAG